MKRSEQDEARAMSVRNLSANCPYCRASLRSFDQTVECPSCHATYHAECWSENGGCAVLGCSSAGSHPQTGRPQQGSEVNQPKLESITPTPTSRVPRRSNLALYGALTLLAIALLFTGGAAVCVSVGCLNDKTSANTPTAKTKPRKRPLIIPQRGILGVSIGDNLSAAVATLGEPDSRTFEDIEILGRSEVLNYKGTRFIAPVSYGNIEEIETTNSDPQTSRGVGVNSTRAQLESLYPEVSCRTLDSTTWCNLGGNDLGTRFTLFQVGFDGIVFRVKMGTVSE